jgi:putative tricarboxylic transport membrane protein
MLRAIFMPKGVSKEQSDYYVKLLNRVREKPEWKEFISKGAYKDDFMTGATLTKFLEQDEKRHVEIMGKANFLAKK